MKDNFSTQSDQYAKYRPAYPQEFFDYLPTIIVDKINAWDCGTGNGQVAQKLAGLFEKVFATDISQSQLDNAVKKPNIYYSLQPAENTNFPDNFFNLILVAQAIHWFDFDRFYTEVKRVAAKNSLLVVMGYGKLSINPGLDKLIDDFYYHIIGPYWDKERKYIDEHYQTIPFPFEELVTPSFKNEYEWTLDHLLGYLTTWSAVKHYNQQNGNNPIDLIKKELAACWGNAEKRTIHFPLLLRIGKIVH